MKTRYERASGFCLPSLLSIEKETNVPKTSIEEYVFGLKLMCFVFKKHKKSMYIKFSLG